MLRERETEREEERVSVRDIEIGGSQGGKEGERSYRER